MREKRLDIQGLRALAVGLVVIYHLWPGRLSGGYIGVDIFFVISGFLITSHLVREVDRTGTVSLGKFWARRIRRLLPAAFTVLAFSLVAALIIIPKSLVRQAVFEIGASALYLQNWVLAGNSVDYLAADNKPSIVQHFWTLSVEEQFYIFWPVLIVVAIWVARKLGTNASSPRRAVAIALVAVGIISFVWSVYATATDPSSAYFITPTRVWEFALGGLIVFVRSWDGAPLGERSRDRVRLIGGWVGVGFILVAAAFYNEDTPFPGYAALLPVVGAALLLYFGRSDLAWSPGSISRFAPIQVLGDISYAVYLWHWPLIVLYPYVFGADFALLGGLAILVVSVVLGLLTKKFVEDPARYPRERLNRTSVAFAFMMVGVLVLTGASGATTLKIDADQRAIALRAAALEEGGSCYGAAVMDESNDCEDPFLVTSTVDPAFAADDTYWDKGVRSQDTCSRQPVTEISPDARCQYGDVESPERTIALVGDSHAEHLIDSLATYGETSDWRVIVFSLSGCSGLETATDYDEAMTTKQAECVEWGAKTQAEISARDDVDVVLFSNRASTKTVSVEHTVGVWDELRASGKTVLAMRDVPGMPSGEAAPECIETSDETNDPCAWTPDNDSDFMMDAAGDESSPTPIVDISDYLCSDDTCHAVIGGLIVYFDDNHLSYTFGQSLAPYLGAAIDEALR
jgi:peptidoglycan/LPS O-acetylase OafA/YrhL